MELFSSELDLAQLRITELQAANSRLVEERRAWRRRAEHFESAVGSVAVLSEEVGPALQHLVAGMAIAFMRAPPMPIPMAGFMPTDGMTYLTPVELRELTEAAKAVEAAQEDADAERTATNAAVLRLGERTGEIMMAAEKLREIKQAALEIKGVVYSAPGDYPDIAYPGKPIAELAMLALTILNEPLVKPS